MKRAAVRARTEALLRKSGVRRRESQLAIALAAALAWEARALIVKSRRALAK
ncbi:MAG: hypothetical protein JO035_10080 [Betaproteobacteria bacterium]|nr:hypothetical protein [Betaproteobacteria bacterium]